MTERLRDANASATHQPGRSQFETISPDEAGRYLAYANRGSERIFVPVRNPDGSITRVIAFGPAEYELLCLIAQQPSLKVGQMAAVLGLSVVSIEARRRGIASKVGANSNRNSDIVDSLWDLGLLPDP